MSDDPRAAFARTAEAAQRIAGVVAARGRGDHCDVERLLADLSDAERAAGAVFLADLAISLLAAAEGRSSADVAADLSLHLAQAPDVV